LDASLVETLKKGDGRNNNNNDVDFTYKLTFAPAKAPYTIGLVYTVNDTDGAKGSVTTNKDIGAEYQEINASYNFGFATAVVAYGENKNDVEVKSLKLTKSIFNVDATLTYIDADRKDTLGNSNLNKNREYVTLGVSKTF
jgi:predicted porin